MNIPIEIHLEDYSASTLNANSPHNVGVRQLSGLRMSANTHTHTHTHICLYCNTCEDLDILRHHED